jgi:hypothetical protein
VRQGVQISLRLILAGRRGTRGIGFFDLIRHPWLFTATLQSASSLFLLLFSPRPGFLPFLECFHFSSRQGCVFVTRENPISLPPFSSKQGDTFLQRDRADRLKDRHLIVALLQVVVGNAWPHVVHVVQADIAGEPLQDFR